MPNFYSLAVDHLLPYVERYRSEIEGIFAVAEPIEEIPEEIDEAQYELIQTQKAWVTEFLTKYYACMRGKARIIQFYDLLNVPTVYLLNPYFWVILKKLLHTLVIGRIQQGSINLGVHFVQNKLLFHFQYNFSDSTERIVFEEKDLTFCEPMSLILCQRLAARMESDFDISVDANVLHIRWALPFNKK